MKRRFGFALIALLCVMTVFVSGCGKEAAVSEGPKASVAETPTAQEPAKQEPAAEAPKPAQQQEPATVDEAKDKAGESAAEAPEASEAPKAPTAKECLKAYEDFRNGNEVVWLDYYADDNPIQAPAWSYEELGKHLKARSSYSFSDFTRGLSEGTADCFNFDAVGPGRISYSIVDCGNDGIPELALQFEQVGETAADINYICIIKLIDDKLQLVFEHEYGYRSYAFLNEYGLYTYGGSNGAMSHSIMYSYIDATGFCSFIYGVDDSLSAYSLYVPGNSEYLDIADEEGISENIEIEQYYFEYFTPDMDYEKYIKDCAYAYYPLDDEYNRLEGEQLKAAIEGGAYDRFWKSTGLTAYTEDAVMKLVDEKLKKLGITDEIANAKDVKWTELTEAQLQDVVGDLLPAPVDPGLESIMIQEVSDPASAYSSYEYIELTERTEYSTYASLLFSEPWKDILFYSISYEDMADDGTPICAINDITGVDYEWLPGHPLVAGITFYGDMPEWGFSAETSDGTRYFYMIVQSGMDGSLSILPFSPKYD